MYVDDFLLHWTTIEDKAYLKVIADRLREQPYQELLDTFFDQFPLEQFPHDQYAELMYLQTLIFCLGEMNLLTAT